MVFKVRKLRQLPSVTSQMGSGSGMWEGWLMSIIGVGGLCSGDVGGDTVRFLGIVPPTILKVF